MRIYRSEIRLIQISAALAVILLLAGILLRPAVAPVNGLLPVPPGTITPTPEGEEPTTQSSDADQLANTKIVCLGDSYTFGFPGNQDTAWPQYMADTLKVEVINAGKMYQNAADLVARFESDVVEQAPGRVIIFTGIGDALQDVPLETFKVNMGTLVEKAEANHIKPILVLPFAYPDQKAQELITAYREWETSYAQEKGITTLDFQATLFNEEKVMKSEYTVSGKYQGKYPSADGHKAMGDYAAQILK